MGVYDVLTSMLQDGVRGGVGVGQRWGGGGVEVGERWGRS